MEDELDQKAEQCREHAEIARRRAAEHHLEEERAKLLGRAYFWQELAASYDRLSRFDRYLEEVIEDPGRTPKPAE